MNHKLKTHNYTCGFTLIEILVAATLIALLSTIGISGYQAITRSGRDAIRKADLEQVRSALEIYKAENNSYPVDSSCNPSGLVPNYLNKLPTDPKSPDYSYCYVRDSTLTYHLCAHLENGDSSELCSAGNCGSGVVCNYRISNP